MTMTWTQRRGKPCDWVKGQVEVTTKEAKGVKISTHRLLSGVLKGVRLYLILVHKLRGVLTYTGRKKTHC